MPVVQCKNWSINPQVDQLTSSPTLVINELSAQLVKTGKQVYRFGFGQSPFPVPPLVVASLQQHAAEKDYLPVRGMVELRAAAAAWYQRELSISVKAEQIMIGPGSKQLIYTVLQAIDAPLLLTAPSWVSYAPQAQLLQKALHWLPTNASEHYCLSAKTLSDFLEKSSLSSGILLLNYPNNPAGTTYTSKQLGELAVVCRKFGLLVISDEIYGALHFQGAHQSIAQYYPEGTIVTGGLSKWAGAGGWRLGMMMVPESATDLMSACAKIASETFSAVAAPVQYAAVTAMSDLPQIRQYLERSRAILAAVADYVHQRLLVLKLKAPKASGGFYLTPDFEFYRNAFLKKGIGNSTSMCADILEQSGVALLPGSAFGLPAEDLKTRLAFVDFDGTSALEADPVDEDFVQNYCPKIVAGMDHLGRYLAAL